MKFYQHNTTWKNENNTIYSILQRFWKNDSGYKAQQWHLMWGNSLHLQRTQPCTWSVIKLQGVEENIKQPHVFLLIERTCKVLFGKWCFWSQIVSHLNSQQPLMESGSADIEGSNQKYYLSTCLWCCVTKLQQIWRHLFQSLSWGSGSGKSIDLLRPIISKSTTISSNHSSRHVRSDGGMCTFICQPSHMVNLAIQWAHNLQPTLQQSMKPIIHDFTGDIFRHELTVQGKLQF